MNHSLRVLLLFGVNFQRILGHLCFVCLAVQDVQIACVPGTF